MNLQEAIELCRKLDAHMADFGYHVGLIGGVLYRGESTKDVDIIVYPHKTTTSDEDGLHNALEKFGLRFVEQRDHARYGDDKFVFHYQLGEQRVDIFYMS